MLVEVELSNGDWQTADEVDTYRVTDYRSIIYPVDYLPCHCILLQGAFALATL